MGYPRLSGTVDNILTPETRRAMAGWVGRDDRASVRSYLGVDAPSPILVADEPRPGLFSRLVCHFGLHRWVTMTTGRAGFVQFQHCALRCGGSRIEKGGPWPE